MAPEKPEMQLCQDLEDADLYHVCNSLWPCKALQPDENGQTYRRSTDFADLARRYELITIDYI